MWVPVLLLYLVGLGCSERVRGGGGSQLGEQSPVLGGSAGGPDVFPEMLNDELPFRYPLPLYVRRVEGNVLLRLHVSSGGMVVPDSTRLVESSGHPALDSAALTGTRQLRFRPASRRGVPIAVSMLYPVHFRHPEQRPAHDSVSRAPAPIRPPRP